MFIVTHPIYSDLVDYACSIANEHTDPTYGDVLLNPLAKDVAVAFGHPEWLKNPQHGLWDAVRAAGEKHQEERMNA